MRWLFITFLACYLNVADAEEMQLSKITQLTTPAMGFEKAGEAYFSPDGQMISFQAVPIGEDNYQIYTMDLTTKAITKVSKNVNACTCSFFRPDGKKMIFGASTEKAQLPMPGQYKWDLTPYMNVFESNLDGTDPVQLTKGSAYHAECAYSPDGSQIVYASDEDGSMNIYVMNSDGSNVRQLTYTQGCYNGGPFFSPDGSKIIFRADREVPHRLQIYMMDADGENVTQLTDNNAVNWAPFWHPSGKGIVYTTSIHGHHNYQIYFLNIETREQHRLTYVPVFNGLPVFNRDGTQMMWTSKRGIDNTSQIFISDITIPNEWLESKKQTEAL